MYAVVIHKLGQKGCLVPESFLTRWGSVGVFDTHEVCRVMVHKPGQWFTCAEPIISRLGSVCEVSTLSLVYGSNGSQTGSVLPGSWVNSDPLGSVGVVYSHSVPYVVTVHTLGQCCY